MTKHVFTHLFIYLTHGCKVLLAARGGKGGGANCATWPSTRTVAKEGLRRFTTTYKYFTKHAVVLSITAQHKYSLPAQFELYPLPRAESPVNLGAC